MMMSVVIVEISLLCRFSCKSSQRPGCRLRGGWWVGWGFGGGGECNRAGRASGAAVGAAVQRHPLKKSIANHKKANETKQKKTTP